MTHHTQQLPPTQYCDMLSPVETQDFLNDHNHHQAKNRGRHLPDNDYHRSLTRNHGNISDVARELGVSRATVHARIRKNPELRAHADEYKQ